MNSKPITSYDDLCREKERLQELLKGQKAQIQRDIEGIKDEFRPMVSLSENVSRLLSREDGKDPLMEAGTNIGIDIVASKLLVNSNFLIRFILPSILKNLSSHLLPDAKSKQNAKVQIQKRSVPNETEVQKAQSFSRLKTSVAK